MNIASELLIGSHAVPGTNGTVKGIDAATGEALEPAFGGATRAQLDQACELAWQAADAFHDLPLEKRAVFLETIAQNILDIGDSLIERCMAESGLPRGRIEGERGRTVGQLRMFAGVVRDGDFSRRAHRSGPTGSPAAAARGSASASGSARSGGRLRREQFSTRVFSRRRRYRFRFRGGMSGYREGASGASGHVGAGRRSDRESGEKRWLAGRHVLAAVRQRL